MAQSAVVYTSWSTGEQPLAPVWGAIADVTVDEGTAGTRDIAQATTNVGDVTYSLTPQTGFSLSGTTLTGADTLAAGAYTVEITATSAGGLTTTTFTYTVKTSTTIFPNESDTFLLDYILERNFTDRDADFELGLFTNATVTETTTLEQLTEPSGGSYARKTISDTGWIAGNPRTYAAQDFIPTGGDYSAPIYGYFLATKSAGGTQRLFMLVVRDTPITLTDGELYRISLAIGT